MSALLLAGLAAETATPLPVKLPLHRRIQGGGWIGLALEVEVDTPRDEAERTLLWAEAQHRLLTGYAQTLDVLPVALGALFSTGDALAGHLQQDADRIAGAFSQLAGCSEYILHITGEADGPPSRPADAGSTGADFLRARTQLRNRRRNLGQGRQAFAQDVLAALNAVCRACEIRDTSGKGLLIDASLLVERGNAEQLVATLQDCGRAGDALGLALKLIGPGPAYSFLNGGAAHA